MSSASRTHDPAERADSMPIALPAIESTRRRRMLVIVNPHASAVCERVRELVVRALESRFQVDAVDTADKGHATVLCRDAARDGYDVVATLGGDGTVNEAANGLRGSDTPLYCLPGGSANVFAKMLGVPVELVDATEHLLALADDWRSRKVNLGVVNDRCFTFASGLGLDASVVARVDSNPRLKARLGPYYFAWAALTTFLWRYLLRPPRLELSEGARKLAGITAVIQNGSPLTYFHERPIEVAEGAELGSAALACCVLAPITPIGMSAIALRALSRRARVLDHGRVSGLRDVRELTVRTVDSRPLPLQADGDYLGRVTEARYSVLPDALTVVA